LEETNTAEAEPETEAEPEPEHSDVTDPEPTQAPAKASSGGGIFGSVVGGMIAAAIGFGSAMMIFPQGWRVQDNSALTTLEGTVQDLGGTVQDLAGTVESQAGLIDATKSTLEAEVAALTESDSALSAGVEGLANRLAELTQGDGTAKLPGDVQILLNAQKEEIAKLKATVTGMAQDAEERIAAANAQQETAEQAEARVKARGAAQEIRLALLSGEPFDWRAKAEARLGAVNAFTAVTDALNSN